MRKILFLFAPVIMWSCTANNAPDVSDIQVALEVRRFDEDFFKIDTQKIANSINALREKYPRFLPDYFHNVLGLPLEKDMDDHDDVAMAVRHFIHDYARIKDSADKLFSNFDPWKKQIQQGLQYVKYYFPDYQTPQQVFTFVGPFDAFFASSFGIQGDVLMEEGFGVGLQLHLGQDFSFFSTEAGQELYPGYIAATFNPADIPINCMRNVVDDLFPPSQRPASLIEQIVNSGRRYFLLKKFLPKVKDEKLFGYTQQQMEGAEKNEAVIWDFFLNNQLLNTTDQSVIKNYVGPSPKTQEFGQGSPGNLGSFAGLQIVRKFMSKYPETTLQQLMTMPPREVYEQSKYKPRS